MYDQRFLFLFNNHSETYAMMWDAENSFIYLVRQSDGKTSDGFHLEGYGSHIELKDYKNLVVLKCRSLLNLSGKFSFQ